MATKTYLTYNELPEDFPDDVGFKQLDRELLKQPDTYIIREMIFPGKFGKKDIYVRRVVTDELFITSYTYEELTEEKRLQIIEGAKAFLEGDE